MEQNKNRLTCNLAAVRKLVDKFKNDPASFTCSSNNSDSVIKSSGATNASDVTNESPTKQEGPASSLSRNPTESDTNPCWPKESHGIPLITDEHADIHSNGSGLKNKIIHLTSDELHGSIKSESGTKQLVMSMKCQFCN